MVHPIKKLRLISLLAALCCALLACPVAGAQHKTGPALRQTTAARRVGSARKLDRLSRKLDEFVTRHAAYGFSGAVLVADGGHVLLHKGYGFADRKRSVPNTTATVFPLGSVTKQLTASAIYKLEAEGRLKTTDPIGKYLRGIP